MSSCSSGLCAQRDAPVKQLERQAGRLPADEQELIPTDVSLPFHLMEPVGDGFSVLAGIKR
jgi:hypothetical protein